MPTVEIASINSTKLGLDQVDFDIAIIEENKLESHRGLFYDILQQQDGVIVHLGNPDFKNDKEGGFFAGQIIDWSIDSCEYIELPEYSADDLEYNGGANQQFVFKFLEQYISDIDRLLKIALDKSPVKKIYFLTDYQFGPDKGNIEDIYTINDFWTQHNENGLILNTMYEMHGL
ncbi:hypothetical protein [Dyadobacter pollutisoli]|jgi:hypothetical protein|uniref:Uncharacterized protein n=1 Tax=Dyadobacter pollutisoli TaxID=2910158 RepID=A0A9E8NAS7_9BACT|nr:hypothetical protein [Dyadobacter pollutisoli]WAC12518.1 hypothetical protein ON006_00860 [Dyadobacter pollutisoli]